MIELGKCTGNVRASFFFLLSVIPDFGAVVSYFDDDVEN